MQQLRLALLHTLLFLVSLLQVRAANFTFDFGTPTQCDNFPVSWTGGTPPFQLILAPEFGTPRIFNVPGLDFANNSGSFEAQVPLKQGQTFLAVMSDANGFAAGGISDVLTVGPSVGGNSCNFTDPGADFFFDLNLALSQCQLYTFSGYVGAVQPVTIFGLIPGGESFILQPPIGSTSFDWIANVAAGTSMMFVMYDSLGRRGGSSDVRWVAMTDDTTCLNANSPMSLPVIPSPTASLSSTTSSAASSSTASTSSATSSSSSSSSSSTAKPSGSALPASDVSTKKMSTGLIIGAVLAGVFGLCTLIAVILFIWRRNRQTGPYYDGVITYDARPIGRMNSMDFDPPAMGEVGGAPPPSVNPFPYNSTVIPSSAVPNLAHYSSPSSHNLLISESQYENGTQYTTLTNPHSTAPSAISEYSEYTAPVSPPAIAVVARASLTAVSGSPDDPRRTSLSSSAAQKAAMAAGGTSNRPTRYFIHTDLDEAEPESPSDAFVELPPEYRARRPLPSVNASSIYTPATPTVSTPMLLSLQHPLDHQNDSDVGLQRPILPSTPTSPWPPGVRPLPSTRRPLPPVGPRTAPTSPRS